MSREPRNVAADDVIMATQTWLERAVIGLNLCPFAKQVHVKNQIRYAVSEALSPMALLADLSAELQTLKSADPSAIDTSLLIHPQVLNNFLDFNEFLGLAEAVVERLGMAGEIQVASFHPQYQFEGTGPDDIANYTNRSPYPTLHLLREASITRAVAAFPDPALIYKNNIETLHRLGHAGWKRLGLEKNQRS